MLPPFPNGYRPDCSLPLLLSWIRPELLDDIIYEESDLAHVFLIGTARQIRVVPVRAVSVAHTARHGKGTDDLKR